MSSQSLSTPASTFQPLILFYHPTMKSLADEVVQLSAGTFELGTIMWNKFPDGTPDVKICNVDRIRHSHVAFLVSFRHTEAWVEQLAVMYALPRYLSKSLTVFMPFYPTGTMERVDEEGQVATAMSLSRMLSCIPITQSGPAKVVIFDFHALQTRFYFSDKIFPCLISSLRLLEEEIHSLDCKNNVVIAFPDDGSKKRFGPRFKKFPQVVCSKQRVGNERIMRIAEGTPKDKDVIIVDDLVQSGGTLITCKDCCLQAGAKSVSAYVVHAVFPNKSWEKFLTGGWKAFYVTNSIPETISDIQGKAPFRVLSIAKKIDTYLKDVISNG